MNKTIFILSIAISASGGYWLGTNHNLPDNVAPSSAFIEPESLTLPTIAPSPEINIEKKIQYDDALIDKTEPYAHEKLVDADQTAQRQIDAIKTEYEFRQRSESFTNWLIKNQATRPWFDLGIEMRGRFEAEEIDHYWASDKEEHLRSVFTQEHALAGIAVKSTTCRSTKCQITISVMDHNHINETTLAITKVLSAEKFTHIIVDSQLQQGETTFYLSSNEKGFEFN